MFTIEEIVKNIEINKKVLFSFSSVESLIKVHINNNSKNPDYSRMAFIIFALSKLNKIGKLIEKEKKYLQEIFEEIYKRSSERNNFTEHLFVCMYGMRLLNNLNLDYEYIIDEFLMREVKFSVLYTYPVTMYIYMATYKECEIFRKNFDYSEAIYNKCKLCFEFILNTDLKNKYLPYHFSELTSHNFFDDETTKKFIDLINEKFNNNYLSYKSYSSGIAKCMEDFSRRNDHDAFNLCREYLNERRISKFKNYLSPMLCKYSEDIYFEQQSSQYVCLDTNAHLLISYINLYEKTQ